MMTQAPGHPKDRPTRPHVRRLTPPRFPLRQLARKSAPPSAFVSV